MAKTVVTKAQLARQLADVERKRVSTRLISFLTFAKFWFNKLSTISILDVSD